MTDDLQERVARAIAKASQETSYSPVPRPKEYVLAKVAIAEMADHAQADKEAAVAAEREACASLVEHRGLSNTGIPHPVSLADANAIRARGDTDALERVRQEARAEALREAAEMAAFCLANPEGETLEDRQYAIVWRILALIPDQHKEDG